VRSNDGICAVHDRYIAASSVCARYTEIRSEASARERRIQIA
jgi:hypothetical protein